MLVATPIASVHAANGNKDFPSRFYFQGSMGLNLQTETANSGDVLDLESNYEPGMSFAGALGMRLTRHLRTDIELAHRTNSPDSLIVRNGAALPPGLGANANGDVSSTSVMANIYFELTGMNKKPQRLMPYLMGGVGYARVNADITSNGLRVVDDDDYVPAYQVGGGIGYYFTEKIALDLGYRFFLTDDPEFDDAAGDPFDSEFDSHSIMATLRYDL